jgi:hypothetical protein
MLESTRVVRCVVLNGERPDVPVQVQTAVATRVKTFTAHAVVPHALHAWHHLRAQVSFRQEGRCTHACFRRDPPTSLAHLEAQLLKASLRSWFFQHEDHKLFQSLPEAGARLADSGDDRGRSLTSASMQALAGPSPVQSSSTCGLCCIKPLRKALQHGAFRSLREPWAKAYSRRKRAEGKRHTVAVRALATVRVRLVSAIWTRKEVDHTATFEAAQLAHARRVA